MGRQPGHRQRGAGAVTVSRGDVERQGVLCKEWQRTPMQLLHEYCHAKKRRNAFYPNAKAPEGRFRVRCVLPDDKNSAKDLKFCPTQDFDSLDEAKHCAALLALHYVEPLRPLERKLPDPFRDLWLAMADTNKAPDTKPSKKAQKPQAPVPPPPAPITTSVAANGDSGMDLWGDATADSSDAASTASSPASFFPTELTADRAFASHAEFERAKLEKLQLRNKKTRQRENRERANEHKTVFMSAACRDQIERVLRSLGTIQGSKGEDDDRDDSNAERSAALDALNARVSTQLQAIGFTPAHVRGALHACRAVSVTEDDGASDALVLLPQLLDWLCLNVPEGELPKGFNPAGTQLDVVASAAGTATSSASPVLVQRLMKHGFDRRDAVAVVNAYVEDHPDALEAMDAVDNPALRLALFKALWPHLLAHFAIDTAALATSAQAAALLDAEELEAMRQDEWLALEAIYDDRCSVQLLEDTAAQTQTQLLTLQVTDDVTLDVFVGPQYPFVLPLVALTTTNPTLQPFVFATTGRVVQVCATMVGDPMIYDMCVTVDTVLTEYAAAARSRKNTKAAPAPTIVLLPHAAPAKPVKAEKPAAVGLEKPVMTRSNRQSKPRSSRSSQQQPPTARRIDLETVQRLSEALTAARDRKATTPAFQQMQLARAKLPAANECATITQLLITHQVLLVCGATGCGKTTQVPQFILDDWIGRQQGGACNIVCTQPRRIAAIGVATRVAQERCEAIADVVGYQIRMETKKSSHTRLLFCTTGVLLRRLLSDRQLAGVTHIIVDEVHERNIDTDFLLSILRDLLPQRPDLRLILMSATMNASLFVDYFASPMRPPCPVLDIPGFTFPVTVQYLDDILALTSYDVPKKLLLDKKKNNKPISDTTTDTDAEATTADDDNRAVRRSPQMLAELIDDSRIDYDLVALLVTHLVAENKTNNGAILVFLPGTAEIKRLIEMLTHASSGIANKIVALPLHGSLSGADQALVFRPAPSTKTKIIVSTNIAETSITINDITVVVDCGKVKEMVYDSRQRRSQLLDCWAAQAACDQRKGRAGRVQAGTCYRVFARSRFGAMAPQLSAEIHRVSLEQLCLQIKKLALGPIRGFLANAIEPPQQDAIDAAMRELVEIAAFQPTSGATDNEEVTLTPLGSHLAMLPLDARIGKFLVYGSILRCIEPVAIIAACISSKNPFVMSMMDPELRAKQEALKNVVDSSNWKSDHLLLWKVVEQFSALRGMKLRRMYCKDHGLSYETLESIVDLKSQYLQQLEAIGFYDPRNIATLNANANVPRIIKAALCAGLYSNVAQVVYPEQKYLQSAHGVVTEEHDAKKIRYFIKAPPSPLPAAGGGGQSNGRSQQQFVPRERVFLHPSSRNFTQKQYDSPWLLYTELVQTSKVFVRESTMVNPYALLLFGGDLEVVHEKNLLRLDAWIQFSAVARIGVLIKAIRKHLDVLLSEKIENPALDIAQSELVSAISHLLKTEGM